MENYEFHPWEIWNGGECPCPGEMVQAQLRGDTREEAERSCISDQLRWTHMGNRGDIIAFRRVEKPEIVALYGWLGADYWEKQYDPSPCDTHRLIFEVVNGEPVNPRFERIK